LLIAESETAAHRPKSLKSHPGTLLPITDDFFPIRNGKKVLDGHFYPTRHGKKATRDHFFPTRDDFYPIGDGKKVISGILGTDVGVKEISGGLSISGRTHRVRIARSLRRARRRLT
jgi:hypothetical protein